MTLKNSYDRRILLWVPKRKIKKVPVLNEETKRGRKRVMPQADLRDRISVVHQPLIRLYPTLLQRYR